MRVAAFLAATVLLAAGCRSGERIAGGGSSESGNARVAGKVVDSGGAPLAGARILLIDQESWLSKTLAGRSVVLDSAHVDASGRFDFRVRSGGRFNLQIEGSGSGALLREVRADSAGTGNLALYTASPFGRVAGETVPEAGAASAVLLPGTAYRASVRSDNRFDLDHLPPGRYATLFLMSSESDSGASPGAGILARPGVETSARLAVSLDRFVLEDFSEPWPRGKLTAFTGRGGWYEVRDDQPPASQRSRLERTLVEGPEIPDGPALRMRVVLDSAYAGVGMHFGSASGGFDLSGLRRLTFAAKGRGKVRLTLESPLLDSLGDEQFQYVADIPSTWSTLAVPVDSLRLPPGSVAAQQGITWAQASRSITRLELLVKREFTPAGDTTDLWMDDVTLEGVRLKAFSP